MKKWMITGLLILASNDSLAANVSGNPVLTGDSLSGYYYIARGCSTIECVQRNIRIIDAQINDLLAQRLAYVRRGGELKNSVLIDEKQQVSPNVVNQQGKAARIRGYPPKIAESIFEEIDRQSDKFERTFIRKPAYVPSP